MNERPTPDETKALALIAGGQVRLKATGPRPTRIVSPHGGLAFSTLDGLLLKGWAAADPFHTVTQGQRINLTDAGRSFLPDRNPDAEVPAGPDGPTGDQVLAIALRAAIRTGDVGVFLHQDLVEITGPDDVLLVSIRRSYSGPEELARFLGIEPGTVEDARRTP
jgi:hypothetical protein